MFATAQVRLSDPAASGPTPDVARRLIAKLHDSFRNDGHTPLDAVVLVGRALVGDQDDSFNPLESAAARALQDAWGGDTAAAAASAFQELLHSQARLGLGQYLTPAPICELIAQVCGPVEGKVLDPFAGSALLLERIGQQHPHTELHGIDINPTVARLAKAVCAGLHQPAELRQADAFSLWRDGRIASDYDLVVTNPPFGAVVSGVDLQALVSRGASPALTQLRRVPAELLGLDLSVAALRSGGRLCIVLPFSFLSNVSWARYRADLLSRLQPEAVLTLPHQAFAPYRGVARACVLFGKKIPCASPMSAPLVEARSVGYDEVGRHSGASDLPEAATQLERRTGTKTVHFAVDGQVQIMTAGGSASKTVRLGDIADVFVGRTFPRDQYADEGARVLKVGDLTGSFISWRQRARTCIAAELFRRHGRVHLAVGDICLTAAAHRPKYVGLKVDLVDALPEEGALASAEILVIRLHESAPLTPEELLLYLRSERGYEQIQSCVRGSTAHLYPRDVDELTVPWSVSVEAQARIVKAVRASASAFREFRRCEESVAVIAGDIFGSQTTED